MRHINAAIMFNKSVYLSHAIINGNLLRRNISVADN